MAAMEAGSVDAIVTDPPYGLASGPTTTLEDATSGRGFMGKEWDRGVPGVTFWAEALRVAKPGAYLLAFGGTRAFHRMAVAIEDAGWEVRDCCCWVYGSGFPKSLDASKAIDRAAGATREVVGPKVYAGGHIQHHSGAARDNFSGKWDHNGSPVTITETAPATPEASAWQGWGTALKPAWEPILMARKPLEGTVAANLLKHGTGAINVDGCRIGTEGGTKASPNERGKNLGVYGGNIGGNKAVLPIDAGRWPANFMHDGSPEVLAGFPLTGAASDRPRHNTASMGYGGSEVPFETRGHADGGGSAARFFYCAKTSTADREEGCEELATSTGADATSRQEGTAGLDNPRAGASRTREVVRNHHPTVKPTELMRHLVRLVTPPGGLVLDPFMGSGSTGKAAILEGARFVGCDLDPAYLEIAAARIAYALRLEAEEGAAAYESTRQLSLFGDP
jgi:site-specific DNA-methyltransferase (adenine-specific)